MYNDNNQYGSVIMEQGDLGLGVFAINESTKEKDSKTSHENKEKTNHKQNK